MQSGSAVQCRDETSASHIYLTPHGFLRLKVIILLTGKIPLVICIKEYLHFKELSDDIPNRFLTEGG